MTTKTQRVRGFFDLFMMATFLVLIGFGCTPVEVVDQGEMLEVTDAVVDAQEMQGEQDDANEVMAEETEEAEEDLQGADNLDEDVIVSPGQYLDYSESALADAYARGDKVVLFFHAGWCPYCIQANEEFVSHLDEIPSGVTVLKTDYDSEKTLKQKYGVRYQHTFVQVDANGDLIDSWLGGGLQELIDNVQ